MKRSIQLQPLSREHHDGLLFVWKIREGLAKQTSMERLRKYAGWFWRNHMRPHFYQEEQFLLPYVPAGSPLAAKLKTDHEEILELMIAIDREADKYELSLLANLTEKHIRWEEKEFFQYLEDHLTEQNMDDIKVKLAEKPVLCEEEWKDAFWN